MKDGLLTTLRLLRRVVVVVACGFVFFAVVEVLRAYQTLHAAHEYLGYLFLAGVVALGVWLLVPLLAFILRPKAPRPPRIGEMACAPVRDLKRYAKYVLRVERSLVRRVPQLTDEVRVGLESDSDNLVAVLRGAPDQAVLVEMLSKSLDQVVQPVFDRLNAESEKVVRETVGQVLLVVTASPWRSVDLFVVLQRNMQMVSRISRIYNSSPTLRDQFEIMCGISEVVAFTGIVNLGSRFLERLLARTPLIGALVDDIAQGVGAAMLTSVVGHTAIAKCRSFRKPWDIEETKRSIVQNTQRFYLDIRDLLLGDLLGQLRELVRGRALGANQKPEEVEQQLRAGVEEVFEETQQDAQSCVKGPSAGAPGFMRRGSGAVSQAAWRSATAGARGVAHGVVLGAKGVAATGRIGMRGVVVTGRGLAAGGAVIGRGAARAGRGLVSALGALRRNR